MLIDSHCHLLHRRFMEEEPAQSPQQLLAAARAAGVAKLVTVATVKAEWQPALSFAVANPGVGVAAGLHPNHAHEEEVTEADLLTLAKNPYLVALGETGLDYHYNTDPAIHARQQASFRLHLKVAAQTGLPVVVHTRQAESDTLAILNESPGVPFVLHCFTGSAAMAHQAVQMGGYISFSGVLTFKKSDDLRAIAAALPPERILIETDAPYLAPEPHRSRRNSPALVVHTVQVLARVRGLTPQSAASLTTQNTLRLFPRLASVA